MTSLPSSMLYGEVYMFKNAAPHKSSLKLCLDLSKNACLKSKVVCCKENGSMLLTGTDHDRFSSGLVAPSRCSVFVEDTPLTSSSSSETACRSSQEDSGIKSSSKLKGVP